MADGDLNFQTGSRANSPTCYNMTVTVSARWCWSVLVEYSLWEVKSHSVHESRLLLELFRLLMVRTACSCRCYNNSNWNRVNIQTRGNGDNSNDNDDSNNNKLTHISIINPCGWTYIYDFTIIYKGDYFKFPKTMHSSPAPLHSLSMIFPYLANTCVSAKSNSLGIGDFKDK